MKTGYDIIIHAGQSNAQGCGYGETQFPYATNENVQYFSDLVFENTDTFDSIRGAEHFEVTTADEITFIGLKRNNFSLAFAEQYVKAGYLKEGRRLLIIRTAVGGTSFGEGHWGKQDILYLRMLGAIERAKTLSYGDNDHRFVGLLWHQGESDAMVNASEALHYGNLEYLIRGVREATGESELPFVMGDFVQHWKNSSPEITAQCLPVVNAMRRICADMGGEFVESDGLISNAQNPKRPDDGFLVDTIHFCRESVHELGCRYFAGWQKIAKRD